MPAKTRTRTYPATDPPGLDMSRTFPSLTASTAIPYGGESAPKIAVSVVKGKGVYRTKPIPRPGLRQKDGFDATLVSDHKGV